MSLHAGEIVPDAATVRRLVAQQFPQWAGLELTAVASAGTDNTIYRLGEALAVRLPRVGYAAEQVLKESAWLPRLAPLPLAIPEVMGHGEPGEGFPWPWLVTGWISGETLDTARPTGWSDVAADLAAFVLALRAVSAEGGLPAGEANHGRGKPLAARDARTREAIAAVSSEYDGQHMIRVWEAALAAPVHGGAPVWVHGDLNAGNLLVRDGRLAAVIDFGLLGVGDPAVDLIPAWAVFPAEARGIFRQGTGADAAAWDRGRGWALSVAVIALSYYMHRNPGLTGISRRTIAAVLADSDA